MVHLNYNNKEEVKNYIIEKLSSNKLYKGNNFLKKLIALYNIYPKTITNIIDNIPKITYYKDYLRILNISKNDELNNYIYKLLLTQINQDIDNYSNGKSISTLAKWLPRKGREYDRKLNFVNTFGEKMFGNINRIKLFRKYKKTLSDLTRLINPIEIQFCARDYDSINVKNLTKKNNETYNNKLQKHENLKNDNLTYVEQKINNMNYHQLISRILWLQNLNDQKKKTYQYEIEFMEKMWQTNFEKYIANTDYNLANKYLVLDMNSKMLNSQKLETIKISLLSLFINKYIIINKKNPSIIEKKDSIFECIDNIITNCGLLKNINIDLIEEKINELSLESKKYIILTEKSYDDIINSKNDIDYIKFDNIKLKLINNNKYEGNPLYYEYINKKRELLIKIFSDSEEFKENIKPKYIRGLMILATIYLLYKYYISFLECFINI